MKTAIKIIAGILLLLVIILAIVPFIFKDKILAKVKTEINNNINAKVDFTDFDISILRNFPNLSMSLGDLKITGIGEFEGDTLAAVKNASFVINLMSVISGDKIKINAVNLDQPRIHLLVLQDGKANWDIAKEGEAKEGTAETSQFSVELKKYTINDGFISYNDRSMPMQAVLSGLDHSGSGDFTQDLFTLKTTSDIDAMDLTYSGVSYLNKVRGNLKADLEMDMVNSKYTFSNNEMKLNDLLFGIDGFIAMPGEDINMDLKFNVKENEFRNFISMIPGVYRDGFDKVQSSGKLAFNGFAKGKYNETTMPSFGLVLKVDNGQFKYPDLPNSISNVNIDLNISNPDGIPDHTVINLTNLHAEMGNQPFDARLVVKTPVSDADINASIKGRLDLGSITKMIPLEQGTSLAGFVDANVTAIGRMSSIERKNYEAFNANGNLNIKNFNYKSKDFPQGASIPTCELIFNPKNVTINNLIVKTGNTDIQATGWIDNLLSYMFRENELLKGTMNIRSETIDINQFMDDASGPAQKDTTPATVVEIPSNIDFLVTAVVGKILYDDLILTNAKGNAAIRNSTLGLNDFSFNTLDGTISLDGLYDTKDIKQPSFFFDVNLSGLDIKKVYDKFVAVQKLAPIAERCSGKFSASMNVKGNLDSKMEPVLPSFAGNGNLSTNNVTVSNFTPLVKVADAIKMEQFRQLTLNNVNLKFSFLNGRVQVEPFQVNLGGMPATIAGSNGFDQTINYNVNLKVPMSKIPGSASSAISGIFAKANQAAGTNLTMGNEVNLNINIGGTVTSPVIQTGLKDLASSAASSIKDQVKDQLDAKKDELENKAREEADKLKKEAEDRAAQIKREAEEKAKAESDRLKKEAEEKLKKEAEDKLKNLFGKPK